MPHRSGGPGGGAGAAGGRIGTAAQRIVTVCGEYDPPLKISATTFGNDVSVSISAQP